MRSVLDPKKELVTHLAFLRASALSMVDDVSKADDLVQTTVEKGWHNIHQFEPGTNMRAWLFTILRNTYYSALRTSDREVCDTGGRAAASLAEHPAHDGRLALADFRAAFVTLPAEQREVILLVGAHGFSYEEAAEICNVAVGTVKSRTNRARRRLAELLDFEIGGSVLTRDKMMTAVLSGRNAVW
ncbi:sigma-70 family RNA polymerase sigma factor [Tateyamaria pelophila]|uniref:sigma-70 family RNA polymerase sigma factor n=1 Tax=Tateyamaria pelophila TaxID=328415 RepID=UPI001CC1926B|nr:sigma-70 family RNA polymerase sigma factor [Tateyamaria pelophila]